MANVPVRVDVLGHPGERVPEFPVVLPGPLRDLGPKDVARYVLCLFDVSLDEVAIQTRRRRRQRESAVSHHHSGDAVPAGVRAELVPEHLGVEVRVTVDESRSYDGTCRVQLLSSASADATYFDDEPVVDCDVGTK